MTGRPRLVRPGQDHLAHGATGNSVTGRGVTVNGQLGHQHSTGHGAAWQIAITPANTDLVEPTLSMIDKIIGRGHTVRDLLGDRHYSYKSPCVGRAAHVIDVRDSGTERTPDLRQKR